MATCFCMQAFRPSVFFPCSFLFFLIILLQLFFPRFALYVPNFFSDVRWTMRRSARSVCSVYIALTTSPSPFPILITEGYAEAPSTSEFRQRAEPPPPSPSQAFPAFFPEPFSGGTEYWRGNSLTRCAHPLSPYLCLLVLGSSHLLAVLPLLFGITLGQRFSPSLRSVSCFFSFSPLRRRRSLISV